MMDALAVCCFVPPRDQVVQGNPSALDTCVSGKRRRLGYLSSYLRRRDWTSEAEVGSG